MKIWLKILIAVAVVLLIIQIPAFTPDVNHSDKKPVNDIGALPYYNMMDNMDVAMKLNDACYDCHSNYTTYTRQVTDADGNTKEDSLWYYHIQPLSWWINYHIDKAKKHMNFSEFAAYSPKEQAHKFHEIQKEMEKKGMPLKSYLLMHKEAHLTDKDYKRITEWAKGMEKKALAQIDSTRIE